VRAGWLEAAEAESLARRLALLPLLPLAWLYGAAAALHRGLYRAGWRRQQRLPCRVVSVGNLVVGGAGKTPVAAWLASSLYRRGYRVVLASRGYGGRPRAPLAVVSDGRFVHGRSEASGDEPLVLAAHAPGVPVLVGRDRVLVGWRALSAFAAEVLVLDDGFQHHRLYRDVDVVVCDGRLGLGNGHCLPRGPLREPARALAQAHALGVLDGPLAERHEAELARRAPAAFRFAARRRPSHLRPLAGGCGEDPGLLAGRAVGVLCGLARPAGLRATLEALGARVVAERTFADHHRYRPADLDGLAAGAPLWVTTEKDAVKIPAGWARGADVRVLAIDLEVEEPERLLDWLETRLRRGRPT
jgi:tetraacyldisaccharide 4'-kinase